MSDLKDFFRFEEINVIQKKRGLGKTMDFPFLGRGKRRSTS